MLVPYSQGALSPLTECKACQEAKYAISLLSSLIINSFIIIIPWYKCIIIIIIPWYYVSPELLTKSRLGPN
jgi:hypothetical protein